MKHGDAAEFSWDLVSDPVEFSWELVSGETHLIWLYQDRELTLWERVRVRLFRRPDPRLLYFGEPE